MNSTFYTINLNQQNKTFTNIRLKSAVHKPKTIKNDLLN
jgi:hypothetical protein